MSNRGDKEFLSDIEEAIKRIKTYTRNMSYQKFLKDTKTQDAVVRNLEIIGEAVKNISESLKAEHPNIPWKDMARVRDKVIHFYFGVNYDIVWSIAKEDLPQVAEQINTVLTFL
jgi:uncharacterized protein with HEPN domain